MTINSYSLNGTSYFSNDRDPVLPASVENIVTSVQGQNNIQRMLELHERILLWSAPGTDQARPRWLLRKEQRGTANDRSRR